MDNLEVSVKKLNELKGKIKARDRVICDSMISQAVENDYLKQLHLQCSAQLRAIDFIENGMNDIDKYFVC